MFILDFIRTFSPGLLIAAGVALLIVPEWIRIIIALGLIFVGVTEMYPELLVGEVPETLSEQ